MSITTAQEYQAAALKKYEVTLPSGALFLIRQPNAFWFASNAEALPSSAIQQAQGNPPEAGNTTVERKADTDLTVRLVEAHVIQPKVRLHADPTKGELALDDLDPADAAFILDYLLGRKDKDGNPVATFSRK
jgi:hypothetical protein